MYRVEWIQVASDELMHLWMQADSPDRKIITAATHAIDQSLRADPYADSESREDDLRVLFVAPLGVQFEVEPAKRIVWVLHVWHYGRRG